MSAIDVAALGRLYTEGASARVSHHRVHHDTFRTLCVTLGRLQRALRESESANDAYWTRLMRTAKRFRFDAMASPLAFSEIGLLSSVSSLRSHYERCGGMYPHLSALVGQVIDLLELLSVTAESPLWEAVVEVIGASPPGDIAVVLCETRLLGGIHATRMAVPGLRAHTINQQQLRRAVWYDRLLLFGSPSWYGDHIFQAPRSKQIDVFRFSWLSGRVPGKELFTAPLGEQPPTSHADVSDNAPSDSLEFADDLSPTWLSDSSFAEIAKQADAEIGDDQAPESVRARPFLLEGHHVVFLEAEENASALVIDLEEDEEDRLQRIAVEDVSEGMYVLLRAAGGGDYVVPVADELLGLKRADLRHMQREWKDRLRSLVRDSSLLEVCVRLLDCGSKRANENNVRRWMWERSIRPNDRTDFDAIMKLVGLEAEKDQYWGAMKRIDAAHLHAGQVIRSALLAQVRKADLSALERLGSMEFDLPGAETGRMIASRVLQVGGETVEISSSRVGKPLDTGGD